MEHNERTVVGYWVKPLAGDPIFVQLQFWEAMKATYTRQDVYEVVLGKKIQGEMEVLPPLVFPGISNELLDNPPLENTSQTVALGKQCEISGGLYTGNVGNAISMRKQWKALQVSPAILNAITDSLVAVESCHVLIAKVYTQDRPELFYYTVQLLPTQGTVDLMAAIRKYSAFKAKIDNLKLRYTHYNATHSAKQFHSAWTIFIPMQGNTLEKVSPEVSRKITDFERMVFFIAQSDLAPERRLDKIQDEYDVFLLDNNLMGTKLQLNTVFK